MLTMRQFVNRNGIKASAEWADSNPNMEGSDNMNHFRVTLRMGRKRMVVTFSQGYGISGEPTAESVLECLAADTNGVSDGQSFNEWADEYGYDVDSRKAERTYKATVKQTERLRQFLGDDLFQQLRSGVEF